MGSLVSPRCLSPGRTREVPLGRPQFLPWCRRCFGVEGGMDASEVSRGGAGGVSIATLLGLAVDDSIVLHNSNKLTLRLLPCEVVARVAPAAQQIAQFEIDLSRKLVA